jgi:hypothetical protein
VANLEAVLLIGREGLQNVLKYSSDVFELTIGQTAEDVH